MDTTYISAMLDVACVICISSKVEYHNKEESYKNSTKEIIL